MKRNVRDRLHSILIAGRELDELKRLTSDMGDAFGLDRRIENYQGVRPLALHDWDLDCLLDVITDALADEKEYPGLCGPGHEALAALRERIERLRQPGASDADG